MDCLRQNTAKVQFQKTDPKPSDQEMMQFVLSNGLSTKDVHTLYQDLYDRCIYIKFNTEQKYQEFIRENTVLNFAYTSGTSTQVNVKGASGVMRYVRIFNLPPEITDRTLNEAMHRFGTILSTRREKFGAKSLLPVFSGVRGVYIEIEREIPQFIYIQNIKARIFYDGMKEKCFKCGEETHKKQDCPLLISTNNELLQQQIQQQPLQQPLQSQEAQEYCILQQTQSETDNIQQANINEQNAVKQTLNTQQRVTYSDITKITQLHVNAENKIEEIKKMINLREHVRERKNESESSTIDTENEEVSVSVSASKRGRPSKKTRYTSTKNRIALTDHINSTVNNNIKNNDFIAPPSPFSNNTEEAK